MTFVFGYVFGRKWLTSFVFVSVSAENKMTFSSPVSFSAATIVYLSTCIDGFLLISLNVLPLNCGVHADIYCYTFVVKGQSKEHAERHGQLGKHLRQPQSACSES